MDMEKTTSLNPIRPEYKDRLIGFIDILGFSDLLREKGATLPFLLADIFSEFRREVEFVNQNDAMHMFESTQYLQVTNFSDCIVFSYPSDFDGALYYLLIRLFYLYRDFAELGFLLRGGVDFGSLFHNAQNLYGPALVSAYNIESKMAVYPRVIISDNAYNWGIQNRPPEHSEKEWRSMIMDFIKLDHDGFRFFNFLNINFKSGVSHPISDEQDELEDYFRTIQEAILKLDTKSKEEKHAALQPKSGWAKNYFNKMILDNKLKDFAPFPETII